MAFRGSAVAAGTGTTQTVTVSGIGILQNDIVLLALVDYTGNTLTWPSGFNPLSGVRGQRRQQRTICLLQDSDRERAYYLLGEWCEFWWCTYLPRLFRA